MSDGRRKLRTKSQESVKWVSSRLRCLCRLERPEGLAWRRPQLGRKMGPGCQLMVGETRDHAERDRAKEGAG